MPSILYARCYYMLFLSEFFSGCFLLLHYQNECDLGLKLPKTKDS